MVSTSITLMINLGLGVLYNCLQFLMARRGFTTSIATGFTTTWCCRLQVEHHQLGKA
jgi:hypothetical protein